MIIFQFSPPQFYSSVLFVSFLNYVFFYRWVVQWTNITVDQSTEFAIELFRCINFDMNRENTLISTVHSKFPNQTQKLNKLRKTTIFLLKIKNTDFFFTIQPNNSKWWWCFFNNKKIRWFFFLHKCDVITGSNTNKCRKRCCSKHINAQTGPVVFTAFHPKSAFLFAPTIWSNALCCFDNMFPLTLNIGRQFEWNVASVSGWVETFCRRTSTVWVNYTEGEIHSLTADKFHSFVWNKWNCETCHWFLPSVFIRTFKSAFRYTRKWS